jgi:hypothetical protein
MMPFRNDSGQPNNPFAPRKFPSAWCKSRLSEDLLRCIFSLVRNHGADAVGLHSRHPG